MTSLPDGAADGDAQFEIVVDGPDGVEVRSIHFLVTASKGWGRGERLVGGFGKPKKT